MPTSFYIKLKLSQSFPLSYVFFVIIVYFYIKCWIFLNKPNTIFTNNNNNNNNININELL